MSYPIGYRERACARRLAKQVQAELVPEPPLGLLEQVALDALEEAAEEWMPGEEVFLRTASPKIIAACMEHKDILVDLAAPDLAFWLDLAFPREEDL